MVSRNVDAMFSINIIPITKTESEKVIKNALLGVNTEITNWQRRQNENNNFSATVPYELEKRKEYYEEELYAKDKMDEFIKIYNTSIIRGSFRIRIEINNRRSIYQISCRH